MHTRCVVGLSLVAVLIGAGVKAQQTQPVVGTFVLNVAKSTFPGPPLQRATRTFEDAGSGFFFAKMDVVDPSGNAGTQRILARRDGKDYPIAEPGQPGAVTIALTVKSENPFVAEGVIKIDGKVAVTVLETLSADGKTQTITQKAQMGPPGATVQATMIQVWEKQ